MTRKEIVERMRGLAPVMRGTVTEEDSDKILDMIGRYAETINDLNLRTYRLALDTFEQTSDLEVVRYQMLCTVGQ